MDEMTVSIGDILASVVRRGKRIICCGIVFAVLLSGFKGFTIWKNSNEEDYIDLDAVSYEQEKQRLERVIEQTNQDILSQEQYIANSLWMNINPYDKHITEVYLIISDVDERELGMTFGDDTTPRDYLLNSILHQYSILWSAENLSTALGLPQYETVQNKYIHEVVWAEFLDGGVIQVTALGNSETESTELANAAADLLLEKTPSVQENSFEHTLSIYSAPIHQNLIDNQMAEAQHANYATIDTYSSVILEAEKELRGLEKPGNAHIAIIKMALIGGILGGVLACAWYVGRIVLLGSIQSSSQIEQNVAIPFAGILMKSCGVFDRLANWVTGERVWQDELQALDHIANITKLRLPGNRLLLTSTLGLVEHTPTVEKLCQALSSVGIQVSYEDDFFYNANAFSLLQDCDGVLLLERVDYSKMMQLRKICKISQEQGKAVVGFVLV